MSLVLLVSGFRLRSQEVESNPVQKLEAKEIKMDFEALPLEEAFDFFKEHTGVNLEIGKIVSKRAKSEKVRLNSRSHSRAVVNARQFLDFLLELSSLRRFVKEQKIIVDTKNALSERGFDKEEIGPSFQNPDLTDAQIQKAKRGLDK